MSRRVPLSLGLVCLLVLAGCSGFGGSLRTSPSPTISPADVPTDRTPTTPQNQLAPGVLPSGVYNASALAAVHNRTLTNTSFTIRTNVTVTSPNGTVVTSYRSVSRINTTRPRRDVGQTRYRTAPVYVQGFPRSLLKRGRAQTSRCNGIRSPTTPPRLKNVTGKLTRVQHSSRPASETSSQRYSALENVTGQCCTASLLPSRQRHLCR
ncbi:hypothetical protein ACFQL7_28445 [Halocatena marina]|uniref:Uncharacterized protein n=1 Tax=Halocatena marina TaxID=2934937 RepID=A0ABD5YZX0_9EURY